MTVKEVIKLGLILVACILSLGRANAEESGQFTQAQTGGVYGGPGFHGGRFSPGVIEMRVGPSSVFGGDLIRELMATNGTGLSWPPAPRTILEIGNVKTVTSNATMTLRFPVLNVGPRRVHTTVYSVKTAFYAMVSHRSFAGPTHGNLSETNLVRLDQRTMRNYLNVGAEYPRVGYCIMEATKREDRSEGVSIDPMFNNLSTDRANTGYVAFSFLSNFINLREDVSLFQYLDEYCGEIFKNEIKAFVDRNFTLLEMEFRANRNSNCSLPQEGRPLNPAGDQSCLDWHRAQFSPFAQSRTVPRCERQYDGARRCVVKGIENTLCPMYENPNDSSLSPVRQDVNFRRVSRGSQEFYCDQASGLSCQRANGSFVCRRPRT